MRRLILAVAVPAFLLCAVPAVSADPIAVDGLLGDWVSGVTLNGGYDLAPGTLVPTLGGVTYWIEDAVVDPHGSVGPGYGGQNFDVEAAYGIFYGETFYGAVVTGFDKDGQDGWNDNGHYQTGDLFFDVNPGSSPGWDLAIAMSDHDEFVAGNVYASNGGTWNSIPTDFAISQPALLSGTPNDVTDQYLTEYVYGEGVAGEIDYASAAYADYDPADHNVYEVSLAGGLLAGADSILMHYTQECGNDVADLEIVVPEPCTSILALSALLTGIYVRRRRKGEPVRTSEDPA